MTKKHWIDTLIIAFPMNVAPKKVANGIKKCPHVKPAKSNNGFGIDAKSNTTINACFFKFVYKNFLALPKKDFSSMSFSISSSSSYFHPDNAAALATKYGGNSPIAVPNPHRDASSITAKKTSISPTCVDPTTSHFSKYYKLHFVGIKIGTLLHSLDAIVTFAI
jgi:hypothetical protein